MIVVATPTRDSVTAGFTGDLVKLMRRHSGMKWCALLGIYIASLRHQAVRIAQQTGASHLLFIDSDMRFPEDTLERLLAHDRHIVAANCVQRTMPGLWNSRANDQCVSSVGRTGLERVETTGTAVMLIDMAVFERLTPPYFDTPFEGQTHVGEDAHFCRRARWSGTDVWIDHDLSQHVRHQGAIEWGVHNVQKFAIA